MSVMFTSPSVMDAPSRAADDSSSVLSATPGRTWPVTKPIIGWGGGGNVGGRGLFGGVRCFISVGRSVGQHSDIFPVFFPPLRPIQFKAKLVFALFRSPKNVVQT